MRLPVFSMVLFALDMARLVRSFSPLLVSAAPRRVPVLIAPRGATSTDWRLFATGATQAKNRVVFLGTPEVAAESLKMIYEDSQRPDSLYEIVGVVTQPPKRRKRMGDVIATPVGEVAKNLGIPVIAPESAKDPLFLEDLETNVRPDLCITAAYGQYLPKRFLAAPTYGTVNIHPSLLPRWRGASPVQRSLEAGDNPVGVSVLFTVSKMDAGPIISQTTKEIDDDEQATTVLPLLFEIGTKALLDAIPKVLTGSITMENSLKQDNDMVVNADMIDASEAELKVWAETARVCHNKVRGFSMWPGTFVYLTIGDDEPTKVKIARTRVTEGETKSPTNLIEIGSNKKDGLKLVCYDGTVLEVMELQPVTKKVMDAKSFVNGLRGREVKWVETPDTPDPNYHIK